ncbi:MBL fold metallo-hydrolase [Mitsuokella sp. AF33-22]|uniref:MBL fold metallo-hydrolase n=1 Tax=Mitsuokella sp. AF33-22 TaxID=2292047 RepID=UPI000E4D9D0E|nr:MBL fold metallo-hydrolase [Mitsuokella sp. AF33-22]RHM54225.1 MBL fold metallo-hydrolase [Mitsuokella sp. AF33-22]
MILQATVMKYIPTNAYFYIDNETKHGFLIDPGAQAGKLLEMIREKGFIIERILLTHGHFDHIGAVEEIRKALNIPVCMQANGRAYAENPVWNLSAQTEAPITLSDVTYLADYSTVSLAATSACDLTIIPVPGHTTDGAMYYTAKDGVAFVGDSIFEGSYGRTDMYGGDEATLLQNIRDKILTLPDETILLSGHSGPTTVREEKTRPFYQA